MIFINFNFINNNTEINTGMYFKNSFIFDRFLLELLQNFMLTDL